MTHGRSFLHSEYLLPPSLTFRCPHNSSNGTPWQTPPYKTAPSPVAPCGAVGGGLCLNAALPLGLSAGFHLGATRLNGFRRTMGEKGSGPPAAPLGTRTDCPRGGHGVRGSRRAAPTARGLRGGSSPPSPEASSANSGGHRNAPRPRAAW